MFIINAGKFLPTALKPILISDSKSEILDLMIKDGSNYIFLISDKNIF